MGDIVAAAAPIAGAYFGGPTGAAIGSAIGGALAGGQSASFANQNLQDAQRASQFRPVGVTNTFGTTNYTYDDQGRLTNAGYTLSPQLQAYQDQLAGMTAQGLGSAGTLMGLGTGYLSESPEAARQRYIDQQNALVAGSNEQALAGIRNKLFQTGRGGLATGATTAGGMAATNPEMAAYYNALAKQQAGFAADAETAAQNQIKFGAGLLTGAYDPFKAGLAAQQGVEQLGQSSLDLGAKLGEVAMGGAQKGAGYATQQVDPWSTAVGGLLGNQQLISGIGNMFNTTSAPITTGDTSAFDYAYGGGGWY